MKLNTIAFSAFAAVTLLIPGAYCAQDYNTLHLRDFVDELTARYPFLTNDAALDDMTTRDTHAAIQQFNRDVDGFISSYGRELMARGPTKEGSMTVEVVVLVPGSYHGAQVDVTVSTEATFSYLERAPELEEYTKKLSHGSTFYKVAGVLNFNGPEIKMTIAGCKNGSRIIMYQNPPATYQSPSIWWTKGTLPQTSGK